MQVSHGMLLSCKLETVVLCLLDIMKHVEFMGVEKTVKVEGSGH